MLVARPVADLDEAEPVAQRVQPHGFGIDRDRTRAQHALGQIFFVKIDSHSRRLRPSGPAAQWLVRSEEHTSELQSLMRISYAVFCLKKKIKSHAILEADIRR